MPYVRFDEVVTHFIKISYKDNCLDPTFKWGEWASTSEAAELRDDPAALASAGAKDLSRLLTVCIRQDRFVEGALLDAFNSGLILRIVQRAAAILGEGQGKASSQGHGYGVQKKLSPQQAGRLGEFLALAKLNSHGIAAYVSPEGAPGHDLIAIVDGAPKSIEVKTRQFVQKPTEITRWPVDLGTKGDADFFLFVELDLRNMSPTFYLLSNEQARTINKVYAGGTANCPPSQVRLIATKNDFSAVSGGQTG